MDMVLKKTGLINKQNNMSQKANKIPKDEKNHLRSLRLKAGIILAVFTILIRFGLPSILPGAAAVGVLGGLLGGLLSVTYCFVYLSGLFF